jgi:hypothetical protein
MIESTRRRRIESVFDCRCGLPTSGSPTNVANNPAVGPALAAGPSRDTRERRLMWSQARDAAGSNVIADCRCGLPTSGSPTAEQPRIDTDGHGYSYDPCPSVFIRGWLPARVASC